MGVESVADDCETVRARVKAGIATVAIHRPDARNALDEQVREELKRVCEAVSESDARVVVLRGSPESGTFVAGADVRDLRGRTATDQRRASERPRVYERVADLPQPVVARIEGHALGGGCELALACDVRVASTEAELGQPEIRLGLVPGGGATQRLPRVVGEGRAMKLVLTGEPVDGETAAEIGLVDEAVPPDDLDDRVDDLATTIAGHAPVAVRAAKRAIKGAADRPLDAGLDHEAELFARVVGSETAREGIDAFLDDREPEWPEE